MKPKARTPRQMAFLARYHDPKSDTFGNAYQSALAAGYSKAMANSVTVLAPRWLEKKTETHKMLDKAEKNLDKFLDLETKEPVITMIGEIKDKDGNTIMKENSNLMRIKLDTTKFVAERVGRKVYGQTSTPTVAVQINMNEARKEFVT